MPELPDLQVFSKNLKKRLCHQRICDISILNSFKVNMDNETAKAEVIGTEITEVRQYGKELLFDLNGKTVFSIHLMLSGRINICDEIQAKKVRFPILQITFEDGKSMVVSDVQGMAKVSFHPTSSEIPDVLGESFTWEYFHTAAGKNARKNVKAFLLDQNVMKGIGNAYADEILWKANVSPESITGKIPEDVLKSLYEAIPVVLKDAVMQIEKLSPDIISGEVRSFLKVHNSSKRYTEEGDLILIKKIASKRTYYIEKQRRYQ